MSDAERERRLAEMARDAYKHDRDSASDDTLLRSKSTALNSQLNCATFFDRFVVPMNVPDLLIPCL